VVLKKVLIIDDEENIRASLKGVLEDEGFQVDTAADGASGLLAFRKFNPDVVFLDIWMPGDDGIEVLKKVLQQDSASRVVMMSGHGTIETAVKAIKHGAFDFLEKPIHFDKVLLLLQHLFELKDLQNENQRLREKLAEVDELVGDSAPIRKLLQLIEVTAPSNGWVLIRGENGTGKELVARALHEKSLRKNFPFVAVNCAAIPEELIESELFGHEKGAFTGAQERKIGRFEQAHQGTLFLDEVGDMGLKMQAKILRALQDCKIQRVGGDRTIELDVRVIAATNKDLKKLMQQGEFREDLYFRLNVIPLSVPPLRDRKEDIPMLADVFLKRYSKGRTKKLSFPTLEHLMAHDWPGNVRELRNWIERACIFSNTESIDFIDLQSLHETKESEVAIASESSLREAKAAFEKKYILNMLEQNGYNVTKTAQAIGVERSHLHKKMKSYGIETH